MPDSGAARKAVGGMRRDRHRLGQETQIRQTLAYLRHRGAAAVAFWGYGFSQRGFDPVAAEELFQFVKQPGNGGCTIMIGVPNDWQTWTGEKLRLVEQYVSIIQPWNVGRYNSPDSAAAHVKAYVPGDQAWCQAHDKDYYAVIFPGFSWANLRAGQAPLNAIPRHGGSFFWSQAELVKQSHMDMAYVAMFDEVDEGTAIFKCTNNPPVGRFVTYEGLPSDRYLLLAGLAGRLLRGEQVAYPPAVPDPNQLTYRPAPLVQCYGGDMPLTASQVAALRQAFPATPVALLGATHTCSRWAFALQPALSPTALDWSEATAAGTLAHYPVALFAAGDEHFDADDTQVGAIVAALRAYVQGGGTLVILSGGRFPMYYPDSGNQANTLGLRLVFLAEGGAAYSVEVAPGLLQPPPPPWQPGKGLRARMPARNLYAPDVQYQALLPVIEPDTKVHVADAAAIIGPGGVLGSGRLVFLASDLLQHPQKEQILTAVLLQLAAPPPGTPPQPPAVVQPQ